MKQLIAKPLVKDQSWIITDGNKKVGNVILSGTGYDIKVNGDILQFSSKEDISRNCKITFLSEPKKAKVESLYQQYPTPAKIFNSLYDVRKKLHLFTKSAKSKCYHAAGWFSIKIGNDVQVVYCPKYIFLQRYKYSGPYETESEANAILNNSIL